MDIIRIHGYIHDIITAIEAIQNFIEGHTIRSMSNDDKTLSAIIRKFEIMGEAAKRVPPEFCLNHPDIPWSSMAKLRDKLIHHYADIDLIILWETTKDILPTLHQSLCTIIQNSEKS
jgi:uncharacterized protein with HEPN domain